MEAEAFKLIPQLGVAGFTIYILYIQNTKSNQANKELTEQYIKSLDTARTEYRTDIQIAHKAFQEYEREVRGEVKEMFDKIINHLNSCKP